MKTLFILLSTFLFYLSGNCTIKTVVSNTGQGWSNTSNWNPVGVPISGDEVVIPSGKIISVKGSFYNGTGNLMIKIYGTLDFDPSGKLDLGAASIILIYTPTSYITTNGTGSELIKINGAIKYQGNVDGTVNGPKYTSSSTLASPNGFTVGVLPVKLISFSAQLSDADVNLTWQTAEEVNTDQFNVERSLNGKHWNKIATIDATGSNSNYASRDDISESDQFYRLKIFDRDGSAEYSSILKVSSSNNVSISVGPNPASDHINIILPKTAANLYTIKLFNHTGQLVKEKDYTKANSNLINFPTDQLSKGVYLLVVQNKSVVIKTTRVQIQ